MGLDVCSLCRMAVHLLACNGRQEMAGFMGQRVREEGWETGSCGMHITRAGGIARILSHARKKIAQRACGTLAAYQCSVEFEDSQTFSLVEDLNCSARYG